MPVFDGASGPVPEGTDVVYWFLPPGSTPAEIDAVTGTMTPGVEGPAHAVYAPDLDPVAADGLMAAGAFMLSERLFAGGGPSGIDAVSPRIRSIL